MNQEKKDRFYIAALLIIAGALSRLIPHPANFTALSALGIFGGYSLKNRKQAIAVVLSAMLLSDFVIGFHPLMPFIYLALLVPIIFGQKAAKQSSPFPWILGGALASSVSFFGITNFAVWCFTSLYPKTLAGLLECYEAAIPFFKNQALGDLFYTGVIFGLFYLSSGVKEKISSFFNREQTL